MSTIECQECRRKIFLFCCSKLPQEMQQETLIGLCHACMLRAPVNRGVPCRGCTQDIGADIIEMKEELARQESFHSNEQNLSRNRGQMNPTNLQGHCHQEPPRNSGNMRSSGNCKQKTTQGIFSNNGGGQSYHNNQGIYYQQSGGTNHRSSQVSGRQYGDENEENNLFTEEAVRRLNEAAETPINSTVRMEHERRRFGPFREGIQIANMPNQYSSVGFSETNSFIKEAQ